LEKGNYFKDIPLLFMAVEFYFKLRKNAQKPAYLYPYEKDKMKKYEKMYDNISYE